MYLAVIKLWMLAVDVANGWNYSQNWELMLMASILMTTCWKRVANWAYRWKPARQSLILNHSQVKAWHLYLVFILLNISRSPTYKYSFKKHYAFSGLQAYLFWKPLILKTL